jgi:hypothetical protein
MNMRGARRYAPKAVVSRASAKSDIPTENSLAGQIAAGMAKFRQDRLGLAAADLIADPKIK